MYVHILCKNYTSMVVQTIAMAFWYNSHLTFQLLEQSQSTVLVFQKLLQTLSTLKHDFELRRLIFGLTAIVSTPHQALPVVVSQRLADITKQLALLCQKMRDERTKILDDNKDHLKKEEEKRKKGENSDDDGFEDESGSDDDEGDDENEVLGKINRFRKEGKIKDAIDLDEDDDDDDDDSDYEYTGGDLAIYDSALDDIDELLHVRDTFERLNQVDSSLVAALMGGMNGEELNKFTDTMSTAQALKEEEEVVRKRCDELDGNN